MARRSTGADADRVHRIGMVIDAFEAGGAERIAVEVAASLDRNRFSPFVVATRRGGPLEHTLIDAGVEYAILGRRHGFAPGKLLRAHRLLRTADLIHSHKLGSNIWGALFARTTSLPLVVREPTFSGVREHSRTWGYRWWIAPVARRIICPSTIVAQSLYDEGVPPSLVEVIPNGVPLDAALPRNEAREELGLGSDDIVVGIVAQLREEKAHEVLFNAAAELRRRERDVTVCVVGDGVRRPALEGVAAELGLGERVVWAGERRDAKRLASAFDIGVICSDYEGLPVAALEILAAGVPMVSTAVGTMPQILSSGAGIVVPVRDHVALADGLQRLLDDPDARAAAGACARELIRREYSFDEMVKRFEQVYAHALATGESRAG